MMAKSESTQARGYSCSLQTSERDSKQKGYMRVRLEHA